MKNKIVDSSLSEAQVENGSISKYIIVVAAALGVLLLLFYRANRKLFSDGHIYIGDWKFTHYLFNYEDEFVKRGLVGEAFRILFEYPSYEIVSIFSYVILVVLSLLLFLIFARPYLQNQKQRGMLLFLIIALSSPPTIQHFVADVGRFDAINLIIALCCLFLIRQVRPIGIFVSVTLLLGMALLIHEASFFMFLPLVLAYWFWKDSSLSSMMLQVLAFTLLLVATYLISTHGVVSGYSLVEHHEKLQAIYGSHVDIKSLVVVHKGSVAENLERTIDSAANIERLVHHSGMFLLLSPMFFILLKIVSEFFRLHDIKIKILILSAFSPLLLYPLGHDHFRWWSIALTNLFLVMAFILYDNKDLRMSVSGLLEQYSALAKTVVLLGIWLGPLGITGSFKVVKKSLPFFKQMLTSF